MALSNEPSGSTGGPGPAYLRDPRQRQLRTRVVDSGMAPEGPWVRLADTVLYPEGGGQPSDHGTIDGAPVLEILQEGDCTRYRLGPGAGELPRPGEMVAVELDWERRWDLMQQHSAQHLITAIASDHFGWPTTSFHLGDAVCDIELETPVLTSENLDELEERVSEEIRAARPIETRWVTPAQFETLTGEVRTRGLPANHRGPIRLVAIVGVDLNTCGGTHLSNTAEIETVKLLDWEKMRGGSRMRWVAGARVRRRLARHEERCGELRRLLEASDDELVAVARTRLERLHEMTRRTRTLSGRLGVLLVEEWSRSGEDALAVHLEWADAEELRALTRPLSEIEGLRLALLTVGTVAPHPMVLVSPGSELAASVGSNVLERLGGRGGGRGPVFQGRSDRAVDPEGDLVWLRTQMGGTG